MSTPIADVSHYQNEINWPEYATARQFAFIKATEWVDYQDPKFAINWRNAKAAKVMRAPYHFWRNVSVEGQLSNLMTTLAGDLGEGAVMVDMEIDSCDYTALYQFCRELKDRFLRVIIYSSVRYWKDNNPRWLEFDLYVADWTPPVSIPLPWGNYKFWQQGVSGYGEVPGVSTRCDYGVFNGSFSELVNYLGLETWPPEDDVPVPPVYDEQLEAILDEIRSARVEMARYKDEILAAIGEPAPPPVDPPPAVEYRVRVSIPRANARFARSHNANGLPIMEIYPSDTSPVSERIQFTENTLLRVLPDKVRADGGGYYYLLLDHEGRDDEDLYLRDLDCVKTW